MIALLLWTDMMWTDMMWTAMLIIKFLLEYRTISSFKVVVSSASRVKVTPDSCSKSASIVR